VIRMKGESGLIGPLAFIFFIAVVFLAAWVKSKAGGIGASFETHLSVTSKVLLITMFVGLIAWVLRDMLNRWTATALVCLWLALVSFAAWPLLVEVPCPLPSFIEPDDSRYPWYLRQWFRWITSFAFMPCVVLAWRKRLD
jgi:hypothetical protein